MSAGPLEGIRVIDVGGWHTGPAAACMLADQGAEVIKIEGPGGDAYRPSGTSRNGMGAGWLAANRNKRFVQLDLKQPDDLAKLKQMVAKADVFIQNTIPGAMARLGLDAETLRAEHPGLIHASVSGYGQSGPYAAEPAFDTLFQALSGMCYIQGTGGKPAVVKTLVVDKTISPVLAQAITAALVKRFRTGEGSTVECSMLDIFTWWMWPDAMAEMTFIGDEGVRKAAPLSEVEMLAPTDDGYLIVTPHMQRNWEDFCRIVNRPELLNREGFVTSADRSGNLVEYFREVRSSLKGKTTAQWCALFREAGIPNAPVLRPDELPNHPQILHYGSIETVEDPLLGSYLSPRAPVRIDGVAAGTRRAPQLAGVDSEAVLREWGIT
jgi:crotonobetainyl-CoA:carnitine CoA-transferase CaiB-like acyl-CoA transferase